MSLHFSQVRNLGVYEHCDLVVYQVSVEQTEIKDMMTEVVRPYQERKAKADRERAVRIKKRRIEDAKKQITRLKNEVKNLQS